MGYEYRRFASASPAMQLVATSATHPSIKPARITPPRLASIGAEDAEEAAVSLPETCDASTMDSITSIKLSKRQLECLQGVAEHLDSQQIAHRLGISPHTVDSHIAAAIKALGAQSRRDAVKRASMMTGQPLTGQFSPVDHHTPSPEVFDPPVIVREERTPFEVAAPAIKQDRAETRDDRVEQHPLRLIALITAVAAALVVLILAMDPLIQSAARLANVIDPFETSD